MMFRLRYMGPGAPNTLVLRGAGARWRCEGMASESAAFQRLSSQNAMVPQWME
ncbi:hypothetical protein DLJ82_1137 [Rhizobium leguminosarum]|uniref:Uncharacterized protein n=1 Tax=Rhizobium leguminosarum TaxID=384 RepID=A0A2Z4YEQ9_RHILE|nr:hypothetical protein DLJ82_1137 [Rhizobium leguminosarum]